MPVSGRSCSCSGRRLLSACSVSRCVTTTKRLTAQHIFGPSTLGEKCGSFAQDLVHDFVAVGIVEFLEMIEVEHEHAQKLSGASSATNLALEHFFEIATVRGKNSFGRWAKEKET